MKTCCSITTIAAAIACTAALGWSLGLAPHATHAMQSEGVREVKQVAKPAAAAGDTYEVDGGHSSNMFKINHMGVANFMGRFNKMGGTYTMDPAKLEASTFEITIDADSVDTNSEGRDKHLRNPDFFNTAEYPNITFKSTKVEKVGDNMLNVTGDLTFRGVTKPVTAKFQIFPGKETRQGFKSGFEANFSIKRTDFGNDTYVAQGGLGDEVQVTVCVEGAKK